MSTVVRELLKDPQVIFYFFALGWSIYESFTRAKCKCQIYIALFFMSLTWFYIMRWTNEYKQNGGMNLFDDAYVDVVKPPHFGLSSQLLTWVVVATVWMHEAHVSYIIFGMLGAMSAAFVTWVPDKMKKSSRRIPLCYLPTSIFSIISITQLPQTLHSSADFSVWLKALHVLLILPRAFVFLAPDQLKIDGSVLYAMLGCAIFMLHRFNPAFNTFGIPASDCQKSITFDMIFCSFITLYEIYRYNSNEKNNSVYKTLAASMLLPVLSPGAILAFHLSIKHSEGFHARCITWMQKEFATRRQQSSITTDEKKTDNLNNSNGNNINKTKFCPPIWMNLGANYESKDYRKSCENLASILGQKIFQENDGVLACGCGFGAELVFWKKMFKLHHITGIDTNEDAIESFKNQENLRLLNLSVEAMVSKFQHKSCFNKIVALDSVYHFHNKFQFYTDCFALLSSYRVDDDKDGGKIGATDLVLKVQNVDHLPLWMRAALSFMNVHVKHLCSKSNYISKLKTIGYTNISVNSLENQHVLDSWFPSSFLKYLDYALISADVADDKRLDARPKVAVIGSGLSGLTAAHLLSGANNVTIYEANEMGGLSGSGIDVFGHTIDIPLRIIGEGYYTYVEKLARSLDVKLDPIREDYLTQQNYGDNGPSGEYTTFGYSNSWFQNMVSTLPHLFDIYRFNKNVFNSSNRNSMKMDNPGQEVSMIGDQVGTKESERQKTAKKASLFNEDDKLNVMTWAEWMESHGYETGAYNTHAYKNSKSEYFPAEPTSLIMWFIMGQASWMLSCTYEQVLNYPAKIILQFIISLGYGRDVVDTIIASGSRSGRMMRIHPSMKALEYSLSYGCHLKYNKRVTGLNKKLMIDGSKYDFVVIATEASAVNYIMSKTMAPKVFSTVKYQKSSIVLHSDPKLMPKSKSEWKAFNVCQKFDQDMCMLTAWLNEYYPMLKFPKDVFQTWNPHERPNDIIKECHFLRVVHTKETPNILAKIDQLQGENNIYYAGAYSMEGMGLLEQAARSGQKVARLIELHKKNRRESLNKNNEDSKEAAMNSLSKVKRRNTNTRVKKSTRQNDEESWTLIS